MDGCFTVCCDDLEGVTKSDLDRFTDKIENLLNDENGQRLFRNFMFTAKMKEGRKILDFWDHCDRLLHFKGLDSNDPEIKTRYLTDIGTLIDEADRVEELDLATMERLMMVADSGDLKEIKAIIKVLKSEATKALKREYAMFVRHYVPKK